MKPLLLSFFAVIVCANLFSQAIKHTTPYIYRQPDARDDGIMSGNLSEAGMDSTLIEQLTNLIIADSFTNVHSLLIVKDGRLVYENYFPGTDRRQGKRLGYIDHSIDQLHDCRSISKTVVAACIGIAIQQKIIADINDPAGKYLPGITSTTKQAITIKHLLTMTSGLNWKEIGRYGNVFNTETQMSVRLDPVKYILRKRMVARPGSVWNYGAGNTQLLAEILYKVSGLTVDEFAAKYLFSPLGIHHYEWSKLLFKKIPAAASGLRLTSRDLLKIGSLYMSAGKFNSSHIIDSNWVDESSISFIERPDLSNLQIKDGGYGYGVWIYTDTVCMKPLTIIEAKGNGGQSVFLCRSLGLLVVTTGGNYNRPKNHAYEMLTRYIIPSLVHELK